MSFLDKLKSMFSGGSDEAGVRPAAEPDAATAADDAHDHSDGHSHDHTDGHSHDHEPAAAPAPPADPAGMPTSEPQPAEPQGEDDRL